MVSRRRQNRRAFLGSMGAVMAGLAGCTSGASTPESNDATATGTPPGAATGTPSSTPTDTPTATEEPTPTEEPAAPPPGERRDGWTGIERGRVVSSFDTIAPRWEVIAGSAAVSTQVGYDGGDSAYLDSNGDNRVRLRRTFDSAKDFRGKEFSIAVRLKETTKSLFEPMVVLRDLFGNDLVLSGSVYPEATDRWLRLDLGVKEDRGADLNAVKEVWVDHWVGDAESRFYVDDLRAHAGPGKGYLMFTFDDAHSRDYSVAYPTLDQYGFAGACFPMAEGVTEDSNPSVSDYLEMQDAGWDIGGHTLSHEDLTEYSRRDQRLIFKRNKELLHEKGFTHGARFFRTPYSNYDSNSLDLLPEFFEASFVGAGSATGTNLYITDPRTIGFRGGDDYERAKRLIDTAVKHNQLLGLTFHMSKMPSRAAFESVVDHAATYVERGDLKVITPSTLYDKYLPPKATSGSSAG